MKAIACILLFLCCSPVFIRAQNNSNEFGQNRVQFREFGWQFYESDHFNIYFYPGGQELGKFTAMSAENDLSEISDLLDFRIRKKIDILVYNDLSDLYQSNIGIYQEEKNPGGTTQVLENKIFVYFNGDHSELAAQIREGIASIYMERMLAGLNFQEVLQNAVLLSLPKWFTDGLIRYCGQSWSSANEDRLRDAILSGKFKKWYRLNEEDAAFMGHAFWHWLEESQGKNAISNLIYMTRSSRSMENGFLYVCGASVSKTMSKWYTEMFERYESEKKIGDPIIAADELEIRKKKNLSYYQLKTDQEAKWIAYASNDQGRWKVHLSENNGDKLKVKVLKRGHFRNNYLIKDYEHPILDFSPDGKTLGILYNRNDENYLIRYDLEKKKVKDSHILNKFQQIQSFHFDRDADNLLLSASLRGQSDIYLYSLLNGKMMQITNDIWDDLDPARISNKGRNGIMFLSNRPTDSLKNDKLDKLLPSEQFDLYFYSISNHSGCLSRITNDRLSRESRPQMINRELYTYLSDESGIRNRYIGNLESVFWYHERVVHFTEISSGLSDSMVLYEWQSADSFVDLSQNRIDSQKLRAIFKDVGVNTASSFYNSSILEQCIATDKLQSTDLFLNEGRMRFVLNSIDTNRNRLYNHSNPKYELRSKSEKADELQQAGIAEYDSNTDPLPPTADSSQPALQHLFDVQKNKFLTDFDFNYGSYSIDSSGQPEYRRRNYNLSNAKQESAGIEYKMGKVRMYRVRFSTDKVITQLDNSILISQLTPFDPANPGYVNTPLSAAFKLGITDLMEDYKIYGGLRFPTNFGSSEYFIVFENLRKRTDKNLVVYHKTEPSYTQTKVPFTNTPLPAPLDLLRYDVRTNYFEARFKYPLDMLQRVQYSFFLRSDRYAYKADNEFSLNLDDYLDNWLGLHAEYVYDNSMRLGLNARRGLRVKAFAEIQKEIPVRRDTLFDSWRSFVPQINNAWLAQVGCDARYYHYIWRNMIWANRLQMSSSMGNHKIIYYLGGVDDWLAPRVSTNTAVNLNNNYAFQSLATSMRGFAQNARNGNNYFIYNSELRIPLFMMMSKKPVRSNFAQNFQLVGFADFGMAWEGWNPFKTQDLLFENQYGNSPVTIDVNLFKSPFISSYGFGARTLLLGYFVRTDLAWALDGNKINKKPMLQISLSTDF